MRIFQFGLCNSKESMAMMRQVLFNARLGVETQRQWADLSILRITPALLAIFSIVTLLANLQARKQELLIQQAAWYSKKLPTFSDALSIVKGPLHSHRYFRSIRANSLYQMDKV